MILAKFDIRLVCIKQNWDHAMAKNQQLYFIEKKGLYSKKNPWSWGWITAVVFFCLLLLIGKQRTILKTNKLRLCFSAVIRSVQMRGKSVKNCSQLQSGGLENEQITNLSSCSRFSVKENFAFFKWTAFISLNVILFLIESFFYQSLLDQTYWFLCSPYAHQNPPELELSMLINVFKFFQFRLKWTKAKCHLH